MPTLFLLSMLGLAPSASPADVYEHAKPSTAWIHGDGQGRGTGFVIDVRRRWLLTCYHVTGENDSVTVFFPTRLDGQALTQSKDYLTHRPKLIEQGLVVTGKVLRRDPNKDLALVEVPLLPANVKGLSLAPSVPKKGERVQIVGNRYDMSALWGHAEGEVRGRKVFEDGYFSGGKKLGKGAMILEADVPINEGDSGGPLLDEKGAVVGLVAAVAWEDDGMGLFVDLSELRKFLNKAGWKSGSKPREATSSGSEPIGSSAMLARLRDRTVRVRPRKTDRSAWGCLVDVERGLVVTTAEVIGRAKLCDVAFHGKPMSRVGITLAVDRRRNLALVRLSGTRRSSLSKWGNDIPEPGTRLYHLDPAATASVPVRQQGTADLRLSKEKPYPWVIFLQGKKVDAEGGLPLLDQKGRLVAIIAGKSAPQQKLTYALPRTEVSGLLDEFRSLWAPRSAKEWTFLAALFEEADRPALAVDAYSSALRLSPEDGEALGLRGLCYLELGKLDEAEADRDSVLRLHPKRSLSHRLSCEVLLRLGKTRQAIDAADMALSLDREDFENFRARAKAHRLLGSTDKALADIGEALWLNRKSPECYLERALIYSAKKRYPKALTDLERALAHDPEFADAWAEKTRCHWRVNDVPACLSSCEKWLSLRPKQAEARLYRGRCRLVRNDFRGLADASFSLENDPESMPTIIDALSAWKRSTNVPPKVKALLERELAKLGDQSVDDKRASLAAVLAKLQALRTEDAPRE